MRRKFAPMSVTLMALAFLSATTEPCGPINSFTSSAASSADEAAEEVKELIGPQGSVVALKKASAISVTDIGANLRRIHRLLVGLNAAPADISFRAFEVKHIEASTAEHTVRE